MEIQFTVKRWDLIKEFLLRNHCNDYKCRGAERGGHPAQRTEDNRPFAFLAHHLLRIDKHLTSLAHTAKVIRSFPAYFRECAMNPDGRKMLEGVEIMMGDSQVSIEAAGPGRACRTKRSTRRKRESDRKGRI